MVRGGQLNGGPLARQVVLSLVMTITLGVVYVVAALHSSAAANEDATPTPAIPIVSFAVERSAYADYLDLDPLGLSPGDRYLWGPNPLYDGENVIDTGVSVIGECAVFNGTGDCWAVETITFGLDNSTLRVHGIMPGDGSPATLTIFAGTGTFAETSGTVTITANPDGATWHRRFELTMTRKAPQ